MNQFNKPMERETTQTQCHYKHMIKYLDFFVKPESKILDVGPRNKLTELLEKHYSIKIKNTKGDLNEFFKWKGLIFDIVIFSHTLEHLVNPLWTLKRLSWAMTKNSVMIIAIPSRPCILRDPGHYHEMDDYRFRCLMDMAGLKIIRYWRYKIWRDWWFYLRGIRPIIRLIFEYNAVYVVVLKLEE